MTTTSSRSTLKSWYKKQSYALISELHSLHVVYCKNSSYRIVGSFRGRKLSWIGEKYDFRRENFHGLLACATPKDAMPPNFAEKTFANSYKTVKFAKVFPLESFLLIQYKESTYCDLVCHFKVLINAEVCFSYHNIKVLHRAGGCHVVNIPPSPPNPPQPNGKEIPNGTYPTPKPSCFREIWANTRQF